MTFPADDAHQALKTARRALATQSFSALLQAELVAFTAGYAELRLPITDRLHQQHGFVHGGVIAYAADNALAFAGGSVLGPAVVSAAFSINYIRPAQGQHLIARATVVHAGKSQAVCRCEVYADADGNESLCAVAQGTIRTLSPRASE